MVARTPIARASGERAVPRRRALRPGHARAFSLTELLVVMAVTVLLTAMMMPAMQQLRENAQRVVCMSNMAQLGHAFMMYGGDHNDQLPESEALTLRAMPQDLMLARTVGRMPRWDGIGHLYELKYCETPECYYCPSHHGEHLFERYANAWEQDVPREAIYTNYHYSGNLEWTKRIRRRLLTEGYPLVLLTDGLRTAADFNHVHGMNALRGDGSVHWSDDTDGILKLLPRTEQDAPSPDYVNIWDMVQQAK